MSELLILFSGTNVHKGFYRYYYFFEYPNQLNGGVGA